MRLRRPCEHIDEMHPYGYYVEHEMVALISERIVICPGGEFLPEDALVIEKENGEWPRWAGKAIYDLLAPQYANERDRLYLADMMATGILDALAPDQVGEPG